MEVMTHSLWDGAMTWTGTTGTVRDYKQKIMQLIKKLEELK